METSYICIYIYMHINLQSKGTIYIYVYNYMKHVVTNCTYILVIAALSCSHGGHNPPIGTR